jgi:hypothetical protein
VRGLKLIDDGCHSGEVAEEHQCRRARTERQRNIAERASGSSQFDVASGHHFEAVVIPGVMRSAGSQ